MQLWHLTKTQNLIADCKSPLTVTGPGVTMWDYKTFIDGLCDHRCVQCTEQLHGHKVHRFMYVHEVHTTKFSDHMIVHVGVSTCTCSKTALFNNRLRQSHFRYFYLSTILLNHNAYVCIHMLQFPFVDKTANDVTRTSRHFRVCIEPGSAVA